MTGRLGVVTQEGTVGGIDLLGQQPEWVGAGTQAFVQLASLFQAALPEQVVNQPEAAQQEGALMPGQPVG